MSSVKIRRREFQAEGMGSIHKGLYEESLNKEEDGRLYGLDYLGQGRDLDYY